jgi:predicted GNAT superfamily acetyltransferase
MTELTIRMLHTVSDIEKIPELEKKVWQTDNTMPVDQMLTAVKHGGIVLGAFFEDRLIGFQYSFAGFNGQKAYVCSHMLATDPEFRHMKIGEKLKWAQRKEALKLGYDLITWTYDPLESINGYLNIRKLGAICSTYIENCYGDMQDALNQGIASDRFQVWWHIQGQRAENRATNQKPEHEPPRMPDKVFVSWKLNKEQLPIAGDIQWEQAKEQDMLYVPVPAFFQQIKQQNKSLAIAWRQTTREVFTSLFNKGWVVMDVIRNEKKASVHYYILRKKGEFAI